MVGLTGAMGVGLPTSVPRVGALEGSPRTASNPQVPARGGAAEVPRDDRGVTEDVHQGGGSCPQLTDRKTKARRGQAVELWGWCWGLTGYTPAASSLIPAQGKPTDTPSHCLPCPSSSQNPCLQSLLQQRHGDRVLWSQGRGRAGEEAGGKRGPSPLPGQEPQDLPVS